MSLPDELARYFQQRAQQDSFSGVALLTQGSSQLFAEAYGYANRSWHIPNALTTNKHVNLGYDDWRRYQY